MFTPTAIATVTAVATEMPNAISIEQVIGRFIGDPIYLALGGYGLLSVIIVSLLTGRIKLFFRGLTGSSNKIVQALLDLLGSGDLWSLALSALLAIVGKSYINVNTPDFILGVYFLAKAYYKVATRDEDKEVSPIIYSGEDHNAEG